MGLCLFLSAGTFAWTAAWIYLVLAAFIQEERGHNVVESGPDKQGRSKPRVFGIPVVHALLILAVRIPVGINSRPADVGLSAGAHPYRTRFCK